MKDKQKQSKKEENIYLTNYRQFQQKHENLLFTQFSKEYNNSFCVQKKFQIAGTRMYVQQDFKVVRMMNQSVIYMMITKTVKVEFCGKRK